MHPKTQDEEKSDGDRASANSSTFFYLRSTILWPVGGGFEQKMEEVAALVEDAAQDFRDGENELAVRDFVTNRGGDPIGALADAALVAGGAEVAAPELGGSSVGHADLLNHRVNLLNG